MNPPSFPTLETERLHLREITLDDAPALFAIHGDPEVMRWFGADPLAQPADAERLVKLFASWRDLPNPGVRWGLQAKADGELIGTVGLFAWNRGWSTCTLGYELARRAQGQGLMQEALRATLDWGFREMKLHRISAQIHPDNEASLRSVRKLGFVEEGLLREIGYWGGRFHDLMQYSLLSTEFEHRAAPLNCAP